MTSNVFRWKGDSLYSGNEVQGIMPCRGVEHEVCLPACCVSMRLCFGRVP